MTAFRETKGNNLLNLGVVYEDKCAGDPVECDHLKLILTEDTPRKLRRKYGKDRTVQSTCSISCKEGKEMNELAPKESGGEFLLYQTEDGRTRIEVRLQGETAWPTSNRWPSCSMWTNQA